MNETRIALVGAGSLYLIAAVLLIAWRHNSISRGRPDPVSRLALALSLRLQTPFRGLGLVPPLGQGPRTPSERFWLAYSSPATFFYLAVAALLVCAAGVFVLSYSGRSLSFIEHLLHSNR
jgi:hypothetical protein